MDVGSQPPGELRLTHMLPARDGDRFGVLLSFYRHSQSGRSQYRAAAVRWDSLPGWNDSLRGLLDAQPAEPFTLEMLGLKFDFSDFSIRYFGKTLTVLDARRLLSERFFGRAPAREDFLAAHEKRASFFPASFRGSGIFDISDTEWHIEKIPPVTKETRRKKRIIY